MNLARDHRLLLISILNLAVIAIVSDREGAAFATSVPESPRSEVPAHTLDDLEIAVMIGQEDGSSVEQRLQLRKTRPTDP